MSLFSGIAKEVQAARHSLLHLLMGRALGAGLGLLLMALLWRTVPTETLGHYLTVLAALEIVALISGAGWSGVVQRQAWPWLMGGRPDPAGSALAWNPAMRRGIWTVLVLRSAIGSLLGGVLAITLLAASVASIPAALLMTWFALGTLQRALEELLASVMLQDGVQLAALGANLLRVAFVAGSLGLDGLRGAAPWSVSELVMLDLAATAGATAVAALWLHRRVVMRSSHPLPARAEWLRAWRIGLGFWLVQILGLGLGTPALRLFVAQMGGPQLAATHGAAQAMADVVRNAQPLALLTTWLRPLMVKLQVGDGRGRAVNRLSWAAGAVNVAVMLPVLGALGFWTPEVMRWLAGASHAAQAQAMSLRWPSAPPLEWLLLGLSALALLQGLHSVASMRCAAFEQPRPALWATGLALAVLPLAVVLWPTLGPWGAVAAVALAEVLWIGVAVLGASWGLRSATGAPPPGPPMARQKLLMLQHLRPVARGLRPVARGLRPVARGLRQGGRLLMASLSDAHSFARGSALLRGGGRSGAQAQLLKTAHRLDKGLALPKPRPGFGQETAARLQWQCDRYEALHGLDWVSRATRETLLRHARFTAPCAGPVDSAAAGAALPPDLPSSIGVPLTRAGVQAAARADFESLVRSRRSIRQFAPPVEASAESPHTAPHTAPHAAPHTAPHAASHTAPHAAPHTTLHPSPHPHLLQSLQHAVGLALHSPSVCNRSATRVWWTRDPAHRDRLLRHQNGHHGFADQAACLLIISVRTDAFDSVGERHQGWIDGGLFAMTLIHALHHQGLGTCCLNWSVTPDVDRAFKRDAGLPPDEQVVMLVALGYLPEHFTVAHSPRRPLEEALFQLKTPERST